MTRCHAPTSQFFLIKMCKPFVKAAKWPRRITSNGLYRRPARLSQPRYISRQRAASVIAVKILHLYLGPVSNYFRSSFDTSQGVVESSSHPRSSGSVISFPFASITPLSNFNYSFNRPAGLEDRSRLPRIKSKSFIDSTVHRPRSTILPTSVATVRSRHRYENQCWIDRTVVND